MRFTPSIEQLLVDAHYPPGASRAWLAGLIAAGIVLAVTFALSWFLVHVAVRVSRRLVLRTVTDLDDKLLEVIELPLRRIVASIGVYVAMLQLPLPPPAALVVGGFLVVYIAYFAVRMFTQVTLVLLHAYGRRVQDDLGKESFQKDYVPLLSKIVGAVFFTVGLIYVLQYFGQNVSSLVAALGIGGIAIGLAAKDTLGNMFAGFVILLDRPFRPGDSIKLTTGETGEVVEVGTRSTRIRLIDKNTLIVPNTDLVNNRVVNLTYPSHATQASLELRIAYGSDVEAVKALVLAVLDAQPEVVREPSPSVTLTAFGELGLILTASYVISQFGDAAKVQDVVRSAVYAKLREAGVKIPVRGIE